MQYKTTMMTLHRIFTSVLFTASEKLIICFTFLYIKLYLVLPRYFSSGREETPSETNTPIMMKHFLYPILSYRRPQSILQACSIPILTLQSNTYTHPITNIGKDSNISMEPVRCDQLQPVGFLPVDQKTLTSKV